MLQPRLERHRRLGLTAKMANAVQSEGARPALGTRRFEVERPAVSLRSGRFYWSPALLRRLRNRRAFRLGDLPAMLRGNWENKSCTILSTRT